MKTNTPERGIWGFPFDITEFDFLPWAWDINIK